MNQKYDLLIKNGIMVDPASRVHAPMDLAMQADKVVETAEDISPDKAETCLDAGGHYVLPGIIDLHVHAASDFRARFGHRMMALAGVTCALDMSGPVEDVLTEPASTEPVSASPACTRSIRAKPSAVRIRIWPNWPP